MKAGNKLIVSNYLMMEGTCTMQALIIVRSLKGRSINRLPTKPYRLPNRNLVTRILNRAPSPNATCFLQTDPALNHGSTSRVTKNVTLQQLFHLSLPTN